jgi:hypothetical protein
MPIRCSHVSSSSSSCRPLPSLTRHPSSSPSSHHHPNNPNSNSRNNTSHSTCSLRRRSANLNGLRHARLARQRAHANLPFARRRRHRGRFVAKRDSLRDPCARRAVNPCRDPLRGDVETIGKVYGVGRCGDGGRCCGGCRDCWRGVCLARWYGDFAW